MKKLVVFTLFAAFIAGTSFAQTTAPASDKKATKKEAKSDKKEAKVKPAKASKKAEKADKKEAKNK